MRQISLWGPPFLLMAIIFFLSSQSDIPGPPNPLLDRLFKKGAHMAGYGLLAISYARALQGSGVRQYRSLALLLALCYAASDEWHQSFVPGRNGSPLDVLIDLGGNVTGLFIWQRLGNGNQLDASP